MNALKENSSSEGKPHCTYILYFITLSNFLPSLSLFVSVVVNVSRSQLLFNSLVSVDVNDDQLISQMMQDRLLLAPPPSFHGRKTADGPSCLLFKTSDLLRQKPLPPEEEPVNYKPLPVTRPAHSTFDLYRRKRCCEATP